MDSEIAGEKILFEGKTFELVKKSYRHGAKTAEIEIARRSPGVRLIISNKKKMLLIKEFRYELNGYDHRLPGGKIFDTLKEYKEALISGVKIEEEAAKAAKKECLEETGLIAKKIKFYRKANAGLTVSWDLFYFIVDGFEANESGQALEYHEEIYPEWRTFDEVKNLCLKDQIKEYRSVGVVMAYLMENKYI